MSNVINVVIYSILALICLGILSTAINHLTGFSLLGAIWSLICGVFSLPFKLLLRIGLGLLIGLAFVNLFFTISGGTIGGLGLLIGFILGMALGSWLIPLLFGIMKGLLKGWKFILWLAFIILMFVCFYIGFVA